MAVAIALFVNNFIIVNAKVPTGSMESTIMSNDRIVALRAMYLFTDPKRFDIIVFKYPDDEKVLYVKRIRGLPDETVSIVDGKVYINDSDEPLTDVFVNEQAKGSFGPYTVPAGSYFVMGDNRNYSNDSRFWDNKFVKRDKILGKVIVKYYNGFKIYTNAFNDIY